MELPGRLASKSDAIDTPSAAASLPSVWSDGVSRPDSICDTMLGREAGLLGELALLQPALGAQRLDPLAERRHAASRAAPLVEARPAAASARATKTRVIFLR